MATHQHPFLQRKNEMKTKRDQFNNLYPSFEPDDIYFQRLRQSGYVTVPGLKLSNPKFDEIKSIALQPNDIVYNISARDATEEFQELSGDGIIKEFLKIKP